MQTRSHEKELMDAPLLQPESLYKNLDEIRFINRFTAFYSIQLKLINSLIPKSMEQFELVDLGCGGGDFLNYLIKNEKRLTGKPLLSGLDTEFHAINYAQKKFPSLKKRVNWINKDYKSWLKSDEETDIICCNLFCHHLTDAEIIELLIQGSKKARLGIIINDLHRHSVAYYFIKITTQLFSSSEYTKHDAPLSVKRSFTRNDWFNYCNEVNLVRGDIDWNIRWLPTFRFLIRGKKII